MSAIANERDVLLQAAAVRATPARDRALLLAPSTRVIKVTKDGALIPASITVGAHALNLSAPVSWTAAPAIDMVTDSRTAMFAASALGDGQSVVLTARITQDGKIYEAKETIVKVADGVVGATTYTWIRYADTEAGAGISNDPTGKKYIGFAYNKPTPIESNLPGDYTWSLIKGADGAPGGKGADGSTLYTWIAYADNPNGAGMYQQPNAGTTYIGIATNKTTAVESSNPADYVWSRFKGEQGVPGTPGAPGATGEPGANGIRGTVDIAAGGYSSWSSWAATQLIAESGYGSPQNRDRVTLYGTGYAETRFYSAGSWLSIAAYINGNMIVDGTFSADIIEGGVLRGVVVKLGPNDEFQVSAAGLVSAVGALFSVATFGNFYDPTKSSITAGAIGLTNVPTIYSTHPGSGYSAHAIQGGNSHFNTSGIVGMAGAYDFYADGSGTNYGPFTGAHDGLVANDAEIAVGDLLVDVECVAQRGYSNALFVMERSSAPYQRGVRGPVASIIGPLGEHGPAAMVDARAYVEGDDGVKRPFDLMSGAFYELAGTHTLVAVNSVGEGQIRVCGEGGPIGPDDLLVTSSIPGVAMRQNIRDGETITALADDVVRGYTVAKARVAPGQVIEFAAADQVLVIPCIYLGG